MMIRHRSSLVGTSTKQCGYSILLKDKTLVALDLESDA